MEFGVGLFTETTCIALFIGHGMYWPRISELLMHMRIKEAASHGPP